VVGEYIFGMAVIAAACVTLAAWLYFNADHIADFVAQYGIKARQNVADQTADAHWHSSAWGDVAAVPQELRLPSNKKAGGRASGKAGEPVTHTNQTGVQTQSQTQSSNKPNNSLGNSDLIASQDGQ
jgi:hypothetical protein